MTSTLQVSKQAVLKRINRVLRRDEEMVRTLRGHRCEYELGRYFRVNFYSNFLIEPHVDLENLAKELGVLKPCEQVADE